MSTVTASRSHPGEDLSAVRIPSLGNVPGSAIFWPCDDKGWDHPPLFFPSPLLILRVNRHVGTIVETPSGDVVAQHDDTIVTPFQWIDEILGCLDSSARGTSRKLFLRPVCPLAVVSATYEFGRFFNPYENCFPHAKDSEIDDLTVAFHTTGFARMNGKWNLVGRPPSRRARWRNWRISAEATAWPKPPLIGRDPRSSASIAREADPLKPVPLGIEQPKACLSESEYAEAFHKVQEHLHAGDIYQANLTARFDTKTTASAENIFQTGLRLGGDRYACLVRGRDCTHISFSPELFVRKWGRSVITRPIKGTAPRDPEASANETARKLASSEKNRAEHVMIVDLERNDLGRICQFGSVRVDPLMEVGSWSHLLHMESTVSGTLRSRVSSRELFAALFPGGSVTGAPKRRAMEVIGEVENRPRGIYCGAMGWIDAKGDVEMNLPIRTATLHDDGRLWLHAGGGIVADSTVEDEMDEISNKLRFMAEAVKRAAAEP